MAMTTCKECKKEVSDRAKVCPHCGAQKPGERWWHALAGFAVLIIVGTGAYFYFGSGDSVESTDKATPPKQCAATDGQCLFDANLADASYPCKKQIEKTSKYDFEWDDGVFGLIFTHFRNIPEKGQMVFTGDKVKFTNGFNAKVNMIYSCTYDLKSKSVVDVTVKEGRL